MSGKFVDSPMNGSEFCPENPSYKGGPGVYDNSKAAPQNEYPRTPSPNAVPEKFFEETLGNAKPSGEKDQF